jgi:hypothetical protein
MARGELLFIGQRQRSGYGLGDAQIDAQNRATDQIGQIKAQYNALKSTGQLTAAIIDSTRNQILNVIDLYDKSYGITDRGKAGTGTLTRFVTGYIFPELDKDMASINAGVPTSPLTNGGPITDADGIPVPAAYVPGNDYTINVNPAGAVETAGNQQPGNTPGPPPGITIPGTTTTVTANAIPTAAYIVGGIVLLMLLFDGKNS